MTDVAELFSRNPLESPYTDEELLAVINRFREARHRFATEGKSTTLPPKSAAKLSLAKDLGIKL